MHKPSYRCGRSRAPRRSLDFANRNYEICYSEGVALADIKLKSEGPTADEFEGESGGGARALCNPQPPTSAVNTDENKSQFFPSHASRARAF